MGAIALFKGQSAHGVVSDRVELDAALLRKRGYTAFTIDLLRPAVPVPLQDISLFIGYQGWGFDMRPVGQAPLVETAGCPYIIVLGDHPAYHAGRIARAPSNSTVLVSSRNQVAFFRNHLHAKGTATTFTSTVTVPPRPVSPPDRDIDVLVVGHAKHPDVLLTSLNLPVPITDIIKTFVARAVEDPHADILDLYMREGAPSMRKILADEQSVLGVARAIDMIVRSHFRWNQAQAIRKFPVTFVGDDWKNLEREPGDRFKVLPSVPYQQLQQLYWRSRISLNLFPPYYDFHERIVDAMAHGVAVATPKTPWLSECFGFGEDVLDLPACADNTADWLSTAISNGDANAEIATRGRERVAQDFDDEARIDQFLRVLKAAETTQRVTACAASG